MNVREHIEAGHYRTDDKGRALVPMKKGLATTILSVDGPEGEEIIGQQGDARQYVTTWCKSGRWGAQPHELDLLPPPPRKVKVRAWALLSGDGKIWSLHVDRAGAEANRPSGAIKDKWPVIELDGEREEPWS